MGWKADCVDAVVELLWPSQCPVCEEESGDGRVWVHGRAGRRLLLHRHCLERVRFAPGGGERTSAEGRACGTRVRWAFQDGPEFFRILHAVKYHGRWSLLEALEATWLQVATEELAGLTAPRLVPVPEDAERRRIRGGSVVGWLAEALERCGLGEVEARALVRRRSAPPQARIESAARRRQNVSTLFGVGDLSRVPTCAPLVLLDDQITTGATIRAASSLLRLRGHRVSVLALAGARFAPRRLDP